MEVNIRRNLKEQIPFPKLMQTKQGSLVLFDKEGCGTVIDHINPDVRPVGMYREDWDMSYFLDFYGEVTLSN